MTVIYDLEQLKKPLKNPVLTIGNFDGVHMGHLALFDKVKERAGLMDGQSVVMTFEPHPIKVMKPGNGPPLITPTQQKLRLIQEAGIDIILCIPFTRQFAATSAQDFIEKLLVDRVGIREIVVGYDYTFGRNREGNIELLKKMGARYGFAVLTVEPVHVDRTLASSTAIRNLVQEGNLRETKRLLGRDYQICGTVVKGRNRGGRLLGFPTANLELIDELIPRVGVYAVKVFIDDKIHNGLTNIGYNPTFKNDQFSVETHVLDFSGDLLGKIIRVAFIERLRDEEKFKSIEDLAHQIGQDVLRSRKIFEKVS